MLVVFTHTLLYHHILIDLSFWREFSQLQRFNNWLLVLSQSLLVLRFDLMVIVLRLSPDIPECFHVVGLLIGFKRKRGVLLLRTYRADDIRTLFQLELLHRILIIISVIDIHRAWDEINLPVFRDVILDFVTRAWNRGSKQVQFSFVMHLRLKQILISWRATL